MADDLADLMRKQWGNTGVPTPPTGPSTFRNYQFPPPPSPLPTPTPSPYPPPPPLPPKPNPFANVGDDFGLAVSIGKIIQMQKEAAEEEIRKRKEAADEELKKKKEAAEEQKKEEKERLDRLKKIYTSINAVGHIGQSIVGNRPGSATGQVFDTAASLIPGVAGKVVGAFGSVVTAAIGLTQAFMERGRELGAYSAPLALANARADVKSTLADIREARELGQKMAGVTDAATDIWISIRNDILMPIKSGLLDLLLPLLETIRDGLAVVGPATNGTLGVIKDSLVGTSQFLSLNFTEAIKTWKHMPENFANALKRNDDVPLDLWQQLLKNTENLLDRDATAPNGGGDWGLDDIRRREGPLGIPAIQGL